jgi:hypothetical protein
LYTPDYALAHSFLVACAQSNESTPVKTFEAAVNMLNTGKSAAEIYKLLVSVKRFREFLPKEAPKPVFAIPAIRATVLGKRSPPL